MTFVSIKQLRTVKITPNVLSKTEGGKAQMPAGNSGDTEVVVFVTSEGYGLSLAAFSWVPLWGPAFSGAVLCIPIARHLTEPLMG